MTDPDISTSTVDSGVPPTLPHTVPGPVPGTVPRKRGRPRLDYELLACGFHGHELVGRYAANVRPEDSALVREHPGVRWHRCLRCDAWVPLTPPQNTLEPYPPALENLEIPLRGKRLRDHYVLRLIVIDRIIHAVIVGLLALAIFLFARHYKELHHLYLRILSDLQSNSGGWLVHYLNRVFAVSTTELYVIGTAAAVYTAVLIIEAVGLWSGRRWAEYLTALEVGVFIPYEIYELTKSITPFKIVALVVNLAIVVYLVVVHRLFGVRGGARAAKVAYGGEG